MFWASCRGTLGAPAGTPRSFKGALGVDGVRFNGDLDPGATAPAPGDRDGPAALHRDPLHDVQAQPGGPGRAGAALQGPVGVGDAGAVVLHDERGADDAG